MRGAYINQFLDLSWCQHPADIEDNLDIGDRRLLELKQLGRLLQMLKLKRSFGHFVALAPFLNPGDVVIDLKASLPRKEVSSTIRALQERKYLINKSLNAVTPTSFSKACAACWMMDSSR